MPELNDEFAQRFGESADDGERRLELVRDVGDEVALERGEASLFHGGDHHDGHAGDGHDRGEQDHPDLEQALALDLLPELFGRGEADLEAPVVERRREGPADG